MKYATYLMFLGLVPFAGACGLDATGVEKVEFSLEHHHQLEVPDGINTLAVAAVESATGTVTAHTDDDEGMVSVEGLLPLPDGFTYQIVLKFAEHERAAIPSAGGGGGGHAHGAISTTGVAYAGEHEGAELIEFPLGMLEEVGEGVWMSEYSSADISPHPMGAVRGAEILLVPATGDPIELLSGEVTADESAGGH